ncbi:hypothetical protein DNHGIG_35400 [Collibacillus ludicampi]|uniref:L,D-TPase catalytic domain-containing protein n=1 Tax=Collibacillus ludicampi TaxID=2771369 RepID=A0AAV4LJR0_9BACL|nr:hypothetical protein DNHGIG_35400 [Collibacillus ludicampi]
MSGLKRLILTVSCFILFQFLIAIPDSVQASEPKREIFVNVYTRKLSLIEEGRVIKTYPIAPGTPETPTPVGDWEVVEKSRNWGGGFGTRWIGLNVPWGTYGIHGTNRPHLIGQRVSHGCIRMRNRDVEEFYPFVQLGMQVHILGHPLVSSPYELPNRLVRGHRGSDVYIIQNRLRAAGFYHGPVNGLFGSATEEAIIQFQKANRLPVSKQIGMEEYRLLGLEE